MLENHFFRSHLRAFALQAMRGTLCPQQGLTTTAQPSNLPLASNSSDWHKRCLAAVFTRKRSCGYPAEG